MESSKKDAKDPEDEKRELISFFTIDLDVIDAFPEGDLSLTFPDTTP